jgi:crotonobetainyl-CoA:carnitine CoA-transferase CaiB-like acyl-CoA transferase
MSNLQHVAAVTPQASLRALLSAAGMAEGGPIAGIDGDDPVLPTPFRIAAAGAAAIGAAATAAVRLWMARGGGPQAIRVAAPRAAVAMRSARYLRINGNIPPPLWDKLSGFYPVRDGRSISIHCNFAVHAAAAARVLGTAIDRAAMQAATREWDGVALEDAIHAGGGCAGFVRTDEEWQAHPQSAAVAGQDLLSIERIGDAPPQGAPERPAPATRPLAGLRVLDLTRVLAGPTCARVLAEHGAEVLKINAPHLPHSGAVELDTGMGKLAAHLDLREPADLARLRALAAEADIFSQSYRPGTLAARGLSPADLAAIRPGIVCVTLTAWGPVGPWAARRGFDSIVQCVSGMAHRSGDGTTPRLLPVSAIDYVSGYLMAFGVMVALHRRATEGGSWHVQVGLARVGKWIVDHGLVDASSLACVPEDLPEADLDRFCAEMDSPAGRLRFLAPVAEMPLTPPEFTRPGVAPGTHPAAWVDHR